MNSIETAKRSVIEDDSAPMLTIGRYTIMPYQHGGFWIRNEEGEGMQVSALALEQVIRDFWREAF